MRSLFFAFGSAVGAALAWFVGRREPSRSTVFALTGIACGLLGVSTSASEGTTAGIASAVRHFSATFAIALVYGIGCATVGFVSVASMRRIFGKESLDKPVRYPIMMSLKPSHTPSAAFPRRL
jgi:MFS family permease